MPKMVDERRLRAIKTDISGLAISKTFLWESSFVILPFHWKNGIHFPGLSSRFSSVVPESMTSARMIYEEASSRGGS